jgi:alpha-tubulin suppressor-like RCC1 family protein
MSWRTPLYYVRDDFRGPYASPRRLMAAAVVALVSFIPSGGADTYSAWKARVFSDTEQADPSISGETALSPAGDGIPNLLKYAFALDPHQNGSFALPQIGFSQIVDPITGRPATYSTITYRVSSTDAPSDLYFVPEISFDLQNWVRGDSVFGAPNSQAGGNPGDATLVTYRALSPVAGNAKAFLRLRILEGQTLPDDWQITNFGQTGIDANGDADLDGRSNFDEFLHGTDPNDYYEGRTPILEIVSGDRQRSFPSQFLPFPLIVRASYNGAPLANAPLQFSVSQGDARLSAGANVVPQNVIDVRSDENGFASVYVFLGSAQNAASVIRASAGGQSKSFVETSLAALSAKVVAGEDHSLELDADGRVWIWGDNTYGQLGDGTYNSRSEPLQNSTLTAVMDVSGGSEHNAAVESDGRVWAWGPNWAGQLGDGTNVDRLTPTQIPSLNGVIGVSAGLYHTIALKADGTVWAWGYNGDGELGNGTTDDSASPVQVVTESGTPLQDIVAIAAGYFHNLAVKADGSVWAWGANWFGALGDGTNNDHHYAVQVAGLINVKAVRAGAYHSLAVQNASLAQSKSARSVRAGTTAQVSSGAVWAWGANFSGQLGDGTYDEKDMPTVIPSVDDVIDLAAGYSHNLALKSDGSLWSWGDDSTGQLGRDPSSDGTIPGPVIGLTNIVSVAAGGSHSLALSSNGLIYAWGSNGDGQLGISEEITESGPTPTAKSTNHSGMPDAWQMYWFGRTGVDPNGDEDGDGLRNLEEYKLGTLPNNAYSDGDAVPDGQDGWPLDEDLSPPRLPEYNYAVVDLGEGAARAINNINEVVGDDGNGFIWKNTMRQDLPDRGDTAFAVGINDNGMALFNFVNAKPGIWSSGSFTEIGIGADSDNRIFGWDPNIVWQYPEPYGGAGINNAGTVIGNVRTTWSGYNSFLLRGWPLIWTNSYSEPVLLFATVDANDQILDVDDAAPHGFYKNYDFDANSFSFGGHFDNRRGLDDDGAIAGINNAGQILGTILHRDRVTAFGFPNVVNWGEPGTYNEVTLWTNGEPEPVAQGFYKNGQSVNDDGVTVGGDVKFDEHGQNPTAHTMLWLKVHGEWEEKDLGVSNSDVVRRINRNIQIISGNLLYQNGHAIDLSTRIPSGYGNLRTLGINEQGLIVGQADIGTEPNVQHDHAVLLVPAALVPDYNRDGKIDDQDRGKITAQNPYRFWINDDNDSGDTGGDGIPRYADDGVGVGNGVNDSVNGTKDLIDFFPVFLDIRQLLRILPPDRFEYILQNEDHHLNFIYTDLPPAKSSDYLKTATSFGAAQVNHIGSSGQALADGFLNSVAEGERGVLLFEAGLEVTHPLQLIVTDKGNGQKVAEISLPLSIKSVERMYRHYNALFADEAGGGHGADLSEPRNYPDELCNEKVFVSIHGYNVNPDQARGWDAKMFKSMWWAGSRAKFYGVTWNGSESQQQLGSKYVTTNYHRNVDNAFATAWPFAGFLNSLGANVTVVAHSLGNMVVSSAIHDWGAHVKNYYMVDAAVAIEAYDGGASKEPLMVHEDWYEPNRAPDQNYTERLWASEWYQNSALPTGDARKTLTWRDRLSRTTENTTVYNFYSSGEEVLAEPDATTPTSIGFVGGQLFNAVFGDSPCGEKAWILQEKLKGRTVSGEILGSTSGGWGFNIQWYLDGGIRRRTPQEAGALRDDQLIQDPFFRPGPSDLHNANGSSYASAQAHGNTLLAEMIPARTRPAGGNELIKLTRDYDRQRNVDLTNLENDWPSERPTTRWLHSDMNAVAFRYTWKLFNEFKTLARLDQ